MLLNIKLKFDIIIVQKGQGEILPHPTEYILREVKIMNKTKYTKRDFYNELLSLPDVKNKPHLVEQVKHEIELLDNRKNSTKPTKTQENNEIIKAIILEHMEIGTCYTVSEISKFEDIPDDSCSSQKISALVKQLKDAGLVAREEIKGRAYFSKVNP